VHSDIRGLKEDAYGAIPRVELTLTSYLSPCLALSPKALPLPTKPLRTSSAQVGKMFTTAVQAGACLHTMSILQAYQGDFLKNLEDGDRGGRA